MLAPDYHNREPEPEPEAEPNDGHWGLLILFGLAIIAVALILMGVVATKPWFSGLF